MHLAKDVPFKFDESCLKDFEQLKRELTSTLIIQPSNWTIPFELMCDASDHNLGAVLGQRLAKKTHVIYYASRTMNYGQMNYTTTEKELLAVIFALEKFRPYHIGSKVIVYTNHAALWYLLYKKDANARLIRCGYSYYRSLIWKLKIERVLKMLSLTTYPGSQWSPKRMSH